MKRLTASLLCGALAGAAPAAITVNGTSVAAGSGGQVGGFVGQSTAAGIVFEDGTEHMLDRSEPSDDDVVLLRFLSAVQNEVHRFAITYQKKLMKKLLKKHLLKMQ